VIVRPSAAVATSKLSRRKLRFRSGVEFAEGKTSSEGADCALVERPSPCSKALVAYGSPDDIAKRLGEHLWAGVYHVVLHVLGGLTSCCRHWPNWLGRLACHVNGNSIATRTVTDPSQLKPDLGRFGAMRDREATDSELPLLAAAARP
jgi:hypothetical protein